MTFTSLLDLSQDIDFHWLLSMSFLCWGLTLTFVYAVSVLRLDIDMCLCRFCVEAWHWHLSMSFLCWGLTLTFVYVVSVLRLDIDICLCRFCVQAWHRNGSGSCLSFRSSLFSHLMLLLTRKLQNQGFLVVKLKSFHHTWLINEFITAFDYSFWYRQTFLSKLASLLNKKPIYIPTRI
jgi:hypothetical protein